MLSGDSLHMFYLWQAKADPLEEFCDDNPDADECR